MAEAKLVWKIFGRYIIPFALALSIANFIIAWGILTGDGGQPALFNTPGFLIAITALVAAILLWIGWWLHGINDAAGDLVLQYGLLLSAGVWFARSTTIIVYAGLNEGAMLSLCWSLASAGAWLLERTTGGTRGMD